ncbi:MAG: HAMP domain-containing sensor histidine kinase [Thermodesulfobacteriota bacterium]
MTDTFPLKKILYTFYLVISISLVLLLFMGIRQSQLYHAQVGVVEQTEKLLFQFSIIREHISTALMEGEQMPLEGLSKEMETLNYNLTKVLDTRHIGEEFKLSLVNSIDLPGIVLLLRSVEAGEANQEDYRRLSREIRTLGERLMLFDRVLVNSSRERLIGFQNMVIGASALAVSLLVGMLVLFHRRLLTPLWFLVDDADRLLAGEIHEVAVSGKSKEAQVLAQIINEQQDLKEAVSIRLQKCRQVSGEMVASLGGIWTEIDETGHMCQVNKEMEIACGYPEGGLSGKKWDTFFQAPEGCGEILDVRKLAELGSQEFILRGTDPDQNKVVRAIFMMSQCAEDGCLVRCFGYDVTADKSNIQALQNDLANEKNRKKELVRVSQLTAIGELACGVAHEVSNIGNGIINFAQLLVDVEEDERSGDILHKIIGQGDKITGLASNLLAFGQGDSAAREMVNITRVIGNALALMAPLYKQDGINVELDIAKLPEWHCQAGQLQQLLLGVLINCRQALNERFPGHDEMKRIEVSGQSALVDGQNGVEIDIKDYGIGIADEDLDQVMEPGFSSWPELTSAGMGLSIGHDIAEALDGSLHIESVQGEYTTVRMVFIKKG